MSLKYFRFVAMYRNFSRAAEHFYIGQSALSRQIANLEKELGVQLFKRDTRNVSLTDAGRILYENCDLLLRHHDLIDRLMDAARKGYDGQLSIATVANFGAVFAAVVRQFIAQYPQVKTRIDDIPFDQLSDSILHGVYDTAFTLDFAVPDSDLIARTVVAKDRFVVVASVDDPVDLGPSVTVERLLEQQLIIPRHIDPPFLRPLRLLGREQRGPGGIDAVPGTATALLRVDLGLGVTLIPQLVLASSFGARRYRVTEISDLDTTFSTVLIRRKDNTQTTLQNFVALVRDGRWQRRTT